MGMLCAVSFNRYGRLFYFDPGDLRPQVGDRVLVPTDDGPEVAECVWAAQWVTEETEGFPRLVGPARDSARVQGGIGSCGRDLCCATFLNDFEPVTIRMAKDQDLPLNPLRISGACGRLMCCLKYEHPLYQQFQATAPAVGARVSTPDGEGRVVGQSVPRDAVVVRMDADGSRCSCSRAAVWGSRQAYEARHGP